MRPQITAEQIVGPERQEILAAVRHLLGDLRTELVKIQADPGDEKALRDSVQQLDELFSLVVVGEFNSGKSAFINALLGENVLEEGVTPTTSRIQVLKHGERPERSPGGDSIDVVTSPLTFLRDIQLVDTPGTNAIQREHELLTQHFVPRADLVLFVSSADRPFTESERVFLEHIRQWGKKVVVVINKADILRTGEERTKVRTFVAENARSLLGSQPEIFLTSARLAQQAKAAEDAEQLAASGFQELEEYVLSTLSEQERFRLKVLNPLGVALHLIQKYDDVLRARLAVIKDDIAAVEELDAQLRIYEQDMNRGFETRFAGVDVILHQFENRGHEFLEEMVRVGRVFDLVNRSKVRSEFERAVVADAPRRIEEKVDDIIDWLITSDLKQWEAIRDHFERRKSVNTERISGHLSAGFEYDRQRLVESVRKKAQDTLATYDQQKDASRMAESVQNAVAGAALLEVGAVGLGTLITVAATSSAADVTGIAAAGVMATLGFLVLPHRRRKAKEELKTKISALREELKTALSSQIDREIRRSVEKMSETVAPYTRFVRAEHESLTQRLDALASLRAKARGVEERLR